MDANEFIQELERLQNEPSFGDFDRWLNNYRELKKEMDLKILIFARYFDSIPLELKNKYIDILYKTLDSVPQDLKVTASASLKEKLHDITESIDQDRQENLRSLLEKHGIS